MKKLFLAAAVLLAALVFFPSAPAGAQDDLEKVQAQLEKVMARQEPLSEEDVRVYLENVEIIYQLRFEPDRLAEAVKTVSAWSEGRFAYVTTKMATGMSILMRPGDARNNSIPEFAKPNSQETALIRRHQDALSRAMEAMQAKYNPAPAN